jgi:origin recognition complex subunit 2
MVAEELPGIAISNAMIPQFVMNTYANKGSPNELNKKDFKLKYKWQGVSKKTALNESDEQLALKEEQINKNDDKDDEMQVYGTREASFKLDDENASDLVRNTAANLKTPSKITMLNGLSQTPGKGNLTPTGRQLYSLTKKRLHSSLLTPSGAVKVCSGTPVKSASKVQADLASPETKTPTRSVLSELSATAETPTTRSRSLRETGRRQSSNLTLTQRKAKTMAQNLNNDSNTPLTRLGLSKKSKKIAQDTPNTKQVRRRNALRNEMAKVKDDASESDEDRYVDIDDDEDESDEENEIEQSPSKTLQNSEDEQEQDKEEESDSENNLKKPNYRALFEVSNAKTSSNTIQDLLRECKLSYEEYVQLLPQTDVTNVQDKRLLSKIYAMNFDELLCQLDTGYNLLFHGLGSKKDLFDEFANKCLKPRGHVVIVNGFFPSLNFKNVLSSINSQILCCSESSSNITHLTKLMVENMKEYKYSEDFKPIYLVINNIDGPLMRYEKIQTALAELCCCEGFHLVCSIDHIQSCFLWDAYQFSKFKFMFHDMTTFAPYFEEISSDAFSCLLSKFFDIDGRNSVVAGGKGFSIRGALFVLDALTSNAKKMFELLAKHQLEETENDMKKKEQDPTEIGLSYRAFFNKCKDAFICSTESSFRLHLSEFKDHQLIMEHSSDDNTPYLYIPFSSAGLKQVLEQFGLGEEE